MLSTYVCMYIIFQSIAIFFSRLSDLQGMVVLSATNRWSEYWARPEDWKAQDPVDILPHLLDSFMTTTTCGVAQNQETAPREAERVTSCQVSNTHRHDAVKEQKWYNTNPLAEVPSALIVIIWRILVGTKLLPIVLYYRLRIRYTIWNPS